MRRGSLPKAPRALYFPLPSLRALFLKRAVKAWLLEASAVESAQRLSCKSKLRTHLKQFKLGVHLHFSKRVNKHHSQSVKTQRRQMNNYFFGRKPYFRPKYAISRPVTTNCELPWTAINFFPRLFKGETCQFVKTNCHVSHMKQLTLKKPKSFTVARKW